MPDSPQTDRVNIEVAHVRSWSTSGSESSAVESLLIAHEYAASTHFTSGEPVLSILVDDKAIDIHHRTAWLEEVRERWPHVLDQIDFLCFESDLSSIADLFIARLVTRNRARRAREIARYRDKHGRIACSHDIAIWHSLRLGLLGSQDQLIVRGPGWTNASAFYCPRVVSILEEENREEEGRAAEIMRESSDGHQAHVETIFYAP